MTDGQTGECCGVAPQGSLTGLTDGNCCQGEQAPEATREVMTMTQDFCYVMNKIKEVWPAGEAGIGTTVYGILTTAYAKEEKRLKRQHKLQVIDRVRAMQQSMAAMMARMCESTDDDDKDSDAEPAADDGAVEAQGDAEPGAAPEGECCQKGTCSAAADQ